ncbi:hypothetical protein F0231_01500 [Vibrio sp. RE86]|uniref:hypothetical protein n=1 Tax=Vibrio sp. RE86 TaxID=2607605 RepID=UPI0014938CAE|nr:hypothetical protein [Vibrio sp. RE86]NOH78411.1 hypothetical protein [Vibrio sp. RE86]
MKWIIGFGLSLWVSIVWAEQTQESDPFVNVNMTLELGGIEQAIQDTRQSLDTIGSALSDISKSENLSPEQQALLGDTINNLNQLVVLSKQSVEALPHTFEQSKQALDTNSQRFLDDLRFQALLIIAAVGVVIIAIIGAIFWFVLKPMQSTLVDTTKNISSMASAIKSTAEALDAVSKQQHEIAQRLESVNSGSTN